MSKTVQKRQRRQLKKQARTESPVASALAAPEIRQHLAAEINRKNLRLWRVDVPVEKILTQPCFAYTDDDFDPFICSAVLKFAGSELKAWQLLYDRYADLVDLLRTKFATEADKKLAKWAETAALACVKNVQYWNSSNGQNLYNLLHEVNVEPRMILFTLHNDECVFRSWLNGLPREKADRVNAAIVQVALANEAGTFRRGFDTMQLEISYSRIKPHGIYHEDTLIEVHCVS